MSGVGVPCVPPSSRFVPPTASFLCPPTRRGPCPVPPPKFSSRVGRYVWAFRLGSFPPRVACVLCGSARRLQAQAIADAALFLLDQESLQHGTQVRIASLARSRHVSWFLALPPLSSRPFPSPCSCGCVSRSTSNQGPLEDHSASAAAVDALYRAAGLEDAAGGGGAGDKVAALMKHLALLRPPSLLPSSSNNHHRPRDELDVSPAFPFWLS